MSASPLYIELVVALTDTVKRSAARARAAQASVSDALAGFAAAGLLGVGAAEYAGGAGSVALAGAISEASGYADAPIDVMHQLIAAVLLSDVGAPADLVAKVGQPDNQLVVGAVTAPTALPWFRVLLVDSAGALALGESTAAQRDEPDPWRHPDWAEVRLCGRGGAMLGNSARAITVARGLAAGFALGQAQALLDAATAHARTRTQFGRPIGSFQGVKHALADCHIDLTHSRALLRGALAELDAGDDSAHVHVAMAKDKAGRATQLVGQRCVQAFGGLGFTWEHQAHRHLKTMLRLRHYPEASLRLRAELLDGPWR
jgi:alkylation response protein AidB-like acyl-CoA dehydrogenase